MLMTKKLYYKDSFLLACEANIIDVSPSGIVLDRTVAFPEGGGQEGDRGILKIHGDSKAIEFINTTKGVGKEVCIKNFPNIMVDTPIYHHISEEHLSKFSIGEKVEIQIDTERRMKLTAAHTTTHLVLMGVENLYADYESRVFGCHIKEGAGRIDFRTEEKFSAEDIDFITCFVNEMIEKNYEVKTYPHKNETEAWYWECSGCVYPCGGTHMQSTSNIGKINIKKKNLGKNGQRIYFNLNNLKSFKDLYHV